MFKRDSGYSEQYKNRWIVSYADFVTLLLALFMVLYSLSQIDISNLRDFTNSVDNIFSSENQKFLSEKDENELFQEKKKLLNIFSLTNVKAKEFPLDLSNSKNEINQLRQQLKAVEQNLEKESLATQNAQSFLEQKLGKINGIVVKKEPRGLLIRLKDTVLFDKGSDIIRTKAYKVLDQVGFVIRSSNNEIKIEGHTDITPINTTHFPSNWELSTARATNILRYFISRNNISPSKLSAAGYAENVPIADNSTANGRSINRRVDIIILNSASKIFEPQKVF